MSRFEYETEGQFGVPGVTINSSLDKLYDPYSGIDLSYINSCSHVEVMTLPSGTTSAEFYCDDPYASNGPRWFGGSGEPGACKNYGTVNSRFSGVLPGGQHHEGWLGYWNWIASCPDGDVAGCTGNPHVEVGDHRFGGFHYQSEHPNYSYVLGPAFWGYLGPDGNPVEGDPTVNWDGNPNSLTNLYTNYNSQLQFSSWNFYLWSGWTPPGFVNADHDHNVGEMRMYWTPAENDFIEEEDPGEIFRFAFFVDDWGSMYMDDGCGGEMQLGNGGEFTSHPSGPGCDSCHGDNRYGGGLVNYCYAWFDKTIHKFCPDGSRRLYRILGRHYEHHGAHAFDAGYQSPRGKQDAGGWRPYTEICTRHGLYNHCSRLLPTYTDPIGPETDISDDSSGDGVFYRTDAFNYNQEESRYYEGSDTIPSTLIDPFTGEEIINEMNLTQDGVRNYVSSINCNTVITQKIADFNRMRAVCKDGSYVEMANNGDSINQILDPTPIATDYVHYIPSFDEFYEEEWSAQADSNAQWNGDIVVPLSPEHAARGIDGIFNIEVTRIRQGGDFNASHEYLKDFTIAGYNFGNLSSNHQNTTLYDVAQNLLPRDVEKRDCIISGDSLYIPISHDPTPSVGYTNPDWKLRINVKVTMGIQQTISYVSGYETFTYLSGKDACDSVTYFNSDLYYISDADTRPSLGLFATLDNNVSSENFSSDLMDDIFQQVPKRQFVQNGDGRYVKVDEYYRQQAEAGYGLLADTPNLYTQTYKPQGGWDYISYDGVGINLTAEGWTPGGGNYDDPREYPNNGYQKMFIQHPLHDSDADQTTSYAGFYPYILATESDVNNYGDTGLSEYLQWATWIKSNECYSYEKCLKFQADDAWNDTQTMADRLGETIFGEILKIADNNEYRTINQYQRIYKQGETTINPYSSLNVSFMMKTIEDPLYDVENPPHVQVSVSRGGNPSKGDQVNTIREDYQEGFYPINRLDKAPEIPIFEIMWGRPAVKTVEAPPQVYNDAFGSYIGHYGEEYISQYDEKKYNHVIPYNYHNSDDVGSIKLAGKGDYIYEFEDPPGGGSHYSEAAEFNQFNVCSFRYNDQLYEDVMSWTNSQATHTATGLYPEWDSGEISDFANSDGFKYGIADPTRFDISLSGDPYWSVPTSEFVIHWDQGFTGDEINSVSPYSVYYSRFYDTPNFRDWANNTTTHEYASEYGSIPQMKIIDSRPKILGGSAPSQLGRQYPDTPMGCAQFIAEIVMPYFEPGYWYDIDGGNMPESIQQLDTTFKSTIAYDEAINSDPPLLAWTREPSISLKLSEPMDTNFLIVGAGPEGGDFDIAFEKYVVSSYLIEDVPEILIPEDSGFWNRDYTDSSARYNSHSNVGVSEDTWHSPFASSMVVKNERVNQWEKFEFSFNLFDNHTFNGIDIKSLYLLAQATSVNANIGFRGTVLLDDFKVTEGYKFRPDADVRKKKGPNKFGNADLTKYHDPTLEPEIYKDTVAPLEVQFYFYPRYHYNDFLDKAVPIVYNDFRNGMFYLYDVDWGDDTSPEFVSEPFKIDENTSVYHTYESSGIFEITGTMLRMKPDKDMNPIGVIHNERFVLRIMINEGADEDFTYFGSDGFSFIPYKNTLPIIGGFSPESIYYKSTRRQLGIISDIDRVNTNFKSTGDRLKTELALDKMDSYYSEDFELLNAFTQKRYDEDATTYWLYPNTNTGQIPETNTLVWPESNIEINNNNIPARITMITYTDDSDRFLTITRNINTNLWEFIPTANNEDDYIGTLELVSGMEYTFTITNGEPFYWQALDSLSEQLGNVVYTGIKRHRDELGSSIGDLDITNIRYFNKPIQIWEMFGFEEDLEDYEIVLGDTSDEYLSTLDQPTFWQEYDISEPGYSPVGNVVDINLWIQVGRPDIAMTLFNILGNGENPKDVLPSAYNPEDNPDGLEIRPFTEFYNGTIVANLNHPGNIDSPRYWKNIIDKDTSIFEREGLEENQYIDTYSEQGWLNTNYYYPVLPKHRADGKFIEGDNKYPFNNIPFPLSGPITRQNYTDENLKISINTDVVDSNIFNDDSGNNNYAFAFNDYRPRFNKRTLKPNKVKNTSLIKKTGKKGAY